MSVESRVPRAPVPLLGALTLALLMGGCATLAPLPAPAPMAAPPSLPPPPPPPPPPPMPPPTPPAAQVQPEPEPAVSMPVQGGLPGGVRADSRATSIALLDFAERLRRLAPPELATEVQRLSDKPENMRQPADELQLAMALAHTRNTPDLVRAQALLQKVLSNSRDDARGLHPLAGLLALRYAEQRRLEDLAERQAQQLRDQQRRIDQLNERLEAVRAVERSLAPRPGVPPVNGVPAPRPGP